MRRATRAVLCAEAIVEALRASGVRLVIEPRSQKLDPRRVMPREFASWLTIKLQ